MKTPCDYCESIEAMTGMRNCPIHSYGDPENRLRELWTEKGISADRQNALVAEIRAKGQPGALIGPFTIGAHADLEASAVLEAERCTLEFGSRNPRRVDAGRQPMDESPLFGGPRQKDLFS